MSNRQTINMLIKLSVIADESATIAKSDKEALKNATRAAYEDCATDMLDYMATGATYNDARNIVRLALDAQCLDALHAAIGNGEVVYADLGKLLRKADKLASRLMACAYAVIMGAPDGKINKLEAFAAHLRRGYPLCRVSHMGLTARLADSPDVTRNNAEKADPNEARIAALLAANEALAMELEASKAALQAIVHGGEIIGNMSQRTGKQRSKIIA
jgi:hypothetical protein